VTGTVSGAFFGEISNHLWQSTVFALTVGLLTLACRRNRAQVRYWLWLSASLKFLVPFALLIYLGSVGWEAFGARGIAPDFTAAASVSVMQIARPFPDVSFPAAAVHTSSWLPITVIFIWMAGFGAIVLMRLRDWLRIRAAVRAATPIDIGASVEVRSSPDLLEPGVVGFLHSILLLPQGILQRLTPPQFAAIVAHELSHISRRDNLTAALHMLVEAVFWFYPPIWWIGARLVQERERACDEAVLSLGNEPGDYADAILKVCKLYVESPLTCISGITGPSINRRIRVILTQGLAPETPYGKKIALVMIGLAAVAAPIVLGMMNAPMARAQPSSSASARLQPAPGANRNRRIPYLGTVTANTVVVTPRVEGQLISVNFKEGGLVQEGQVLASIDAKPYRLQLEAAQGLLARDQEQLAATAAQGSQEQQGSAIAQLRAAMEVDQAKVEIAKRQLSYAEVTAPITGIAGFRLVDAGNIVHSGDRLAVIAQLQPISVLFNIQQDDLPEVLARLKAGANPTVVLFNRDGGDKKLAIGRLVAADNQIDMQSGTVTLKATFDNNDGALFPNQFVLVRLLLKGQ
jgi:RND family efflux transporter MFP subunit